MNKVVDFLEKNVQWVALGLGGLFVLWMAWVYIIGHPVAVDVNGQKLGAGEIDKYINDNPVAKLDVEMQNKGIPQIPDPAPADAIRGALALADAKEVTFDGNIFLAPFSTSTSLSGIGKVESPKTVIVTKLPVVPPAVMGEVVSGASNVRPPAQVAGAQPAANGVQPVLAANGTDKNWVTVGFTLSNKDLAKAFEAVQLPQFLSRTAILDVKMIRQEQLADGSWGEESEVKKLAINPVEPMPVSGTSAAVEKDYLQWATANQPLIVQPPFYDVVQGDQWHQPSGDASATTAVEQVPVNVEAFDPNKEYTQEELMKLTPEQRKQVALAKQKKEEDARKGKGKNPRGGSTGGGTGNRPGGGGGGSHGMGGGGRMAPPDPGRPPGPNGGGRPPGGVGSGFPGGGDPRDTAGQGRPNGGTGAPTPPSTPAPGGFRPPNGMPMQPDSPANGNEPANPTLNSAAPCPQGEFNPKDNPDWVGWAHDDTVVPGHTYRYKIVYVIKSPLYGSPKYAKPQDLASTFAITSDAGKTAWTKEVKVPARTSFYVAVNFREQSPTVNFEVFALQGGQKRSKRFDVAPGDVIGTTDGSVDFGTGYTLVDISRDARTNNMCALVASPTGELSRHDFFTDKDSAEYQNDRKGANNAPAAAAQAAATATPAPGRGTTGDQ